jgi:hypothetical protein
MGEDGADAYLKRLIMGRLLWRSAGEAGFRAREQIFDGEFDGHRNKGVLIKVIGE